MTEIANAFVRIRPDMRGFKGETEGGVREAFRGVGKIIGGAFAAAGAFEGFKKVVEAATAHQAQFALLDKTLKNAGQSTRAFGEDMEGLLEKEARLKGFSDEELAQSFIRLVSAAGSTSKAFKGLQAAEDLSRARGIGLSIAALAISKAEQGKATSLQRYGIILPKVTAAEDELKKKREAAVEAGAKFTAAQKDAYNSALAVAKATDAAAYKTEALTLIQKRFGGSSAEFAKTASGQFQRFEQDIHQLEVSFGKNLLPGLSSAAEGVGKFAEKLTENQTLLAGEKSALHSIGQAFGTIKSAVAAVAPTLLTIASAATRVVAAIGSPAILAAVAAYKGVAIAAGLAATAQAFYARAVAASLPSIASATVANTALAASEAATAASIPSTTAATAANTALAASETAAASAGRGAAAGGLKSFLTGVVALGTKGGGVGIAAAGLAVLTGAFVYLGTRTSETERKLKEFAQGLGTLGTALESEPLQKLAVAQADLNEQIARNALATSKAAPGSLVYKQQLLDLRQATVAATAAHRDFEHTQTTITASTRANTNALVDALKAQQKTDQFQIRSLGGPYPKGSPGFAKEQRLETEALQQDVKKLVKSLDEQSASLSAQSPLLAHNVKVLGQYAQAVGKIPTRQTIKFFLDNRDINSGLKRIVAAMKANQAAIKREGSVDGVTYSDAFLQVVKRNFGVSFSGTTGVWDGLTQGIEAAATKVEQDAKQGKAAKKIHSAASAAIKNLRDGLTLDKAQLADLTSQMALQAKQGVEAIASAIQQAESNFTQIGQTIGSDIATVLTTPLDLADQAIQAQGDKLALTFDEQSAKLQARATSLQAKTDKLALTFDEQNVKFQARATAIQAQGDKLALAFEEQNSKFQARADAYADAINRLQLRQQERQARFAATNALITQKENRIGLKNDQLSLESLRRSTLLPGGKELSENSKTALAQLRAFAASAKGTSKIAIQQFLSQYQSAILTIQKDKIGIATTPNPKQAQREANLQAGSAKNALDAAELNARHTAETTPLQILAAKNAIKTAALNARHTAETATLQIESAKLAIQTAALNASHTAETTKLQIRSDLLRIQRDVVTAKIRLAAQEIADVTDAFNRAPTAANLKKVTAKIAAIMKSDHISFRTAGAELGTAWRHGFEAQLTGLGEQGTALLGQKGKGGGQIPSVTKPLDTIAEQQRQADSLTKQYRKTQLGEMKKQTKLMAQIHADAQARKFIKSIQKNPGHASKRAHDLAGTGS